MTKERNFFTKNWFLLLAFSSLILSCIYAAILQAEFKRQQDLNLKLTVMKSISTMPPYILSMITMHNLCEEFHKLKAKASTQFHEIFGRERQKYITDRADFAGGVAMAEFYFNDEINKKLSALLSLEQLYGDTPARYCSNQLISTEELYKKQNEILNLAYKQYGIEHL